ncbi:MAG: hypothetical protein JWN63_3477 [Candidatus Acidoferrum typicum]|jgi:hypothetical protein|nr:hypothetical protein [Candidatus Acidoferrum typicum]
MYGGDDGARTRDLCRDSDLLARGERLRPLKSCKTEPFADRIVDRKSNREFQQNCRQSEAAALTLMTNPHPLSLAYWPDAGSAEWQDDARAAIGDSSPVFESV